MLFLNQHEPRSYFLICKYVELLNVGLLRQDQSCSFVLLPEGEEA